MHAKGLEKQVLLATEDLSAAKILIVDDSEEIRELLRVYLKKAGYSNISTAFSAESAYQLLHCKENRDNALPESPVVDLIIMDIIMPGITGVDACHKLRSTKCYKDIPIIMISAADDLSLLADAFSHGATDYIKKPIRKIELLARISAALKLQREMASRKAWEKEIVKLANQLKEANKELNRLSTTDALTGIANRRLFNERIEHEWKHARRAHRPLSLIMIDIDHFKIYNDNLGHQAGDKCLKQVAVALQSALRRPADFIARYGGEEFTVIIPETDCNKAGEIAENLRRAVATLRIPHPNSDSSKWVTISLGVSSLIPDAEQMFQELIAASDYALYKAKQAGRNRVVMA